jgi:hypothetical protein
LPANIVLVDLENVQPKTLTALAKRTSKVLVFVGATQAKIPFELAAAMQSMGGKAEYIKIAGTGPNALDFHIAFHIGQLAAKDPTARFHIVSKDTGFDPLIGHLRSRQILATRSSTIDAIPLGEASNKKSSDEMARMFVEMLRLPKATRPRSEKTLGSAIATSSTSNSTSKRCPGWLQLCARRASLRLMAPGSCTPWATSQADDFASPLSGELVGQFHPPILEV